MKITKNIGMLLLGAWLVLTGITVLVPRLTFSEMGSAMAILAIAAGVFILIGK